MTHAAKAAALVAITLTFAACAETTIDVETIDGAAAADGVPTTTVAIGGSALELLPELETEMSSLSAQIADEGGQQETLARIERIWTVIRPEVQASNPELVGGIDVTVEMSRTAVNRIRPADADKAVQLLSELAARFTGDG